MQTMKLPSEIKALCWLLVSNKHTIQDTCEELRDTFLSASVDAAACDNKENKNTPPYHQEFILWLLKTWVASFVTHGNYQGFGMRGGSLDTADVCSIADELGLHDLFVRVS